MPGELPESEDGVREAVRRLRGRPHRVTPILHSKFLEQLKRRYFGRIAISYAVVCYLFWSPSGSSCTSWRCRNASDATLWCYGVGIPCASC